MREEPRGLALGRRDGPPEGPGSARRLHPGLPGPRGGRVLRGGAAGGPSQRHLHAGQSPGHPGGGHRLPPGHPVPPGGGGGGDPGGGEDRLPRGAHHLGTRLLRGSLRHVDRPADHRPGDGGTGQRRGSAAGGRGAPSHGGGDGPALPDPLRPRPPGRTHEPRGPAEAAHLPLADPLRRHRPPEADGLRTHRGTGRGRGEARLLHQPGSPGPGTGGDARGQPQDPAGPGEGGGGGHPRGRFGAHEGLRFPALHDRLPGTGRDRGVPGP